jgi:ribosome-associated protein
MITAMQDAPDVKPSAERVSKTRRKQEMHELQALGAALVELSESLIRDLALDPDLRKAVLDAKRISSHEARRRQLQYIGRLMRDVDPAPIRARLGAFEGSSAEATARHKRLEQLRERLLADDAALTDFVAAHPGADAQELRTLIRNARREQKEGRPPRAYRELFRTLKSLEPGTSPQG